MALSDELIIVAQSLLAEFGELCSFSHVDNVEFDIETQSNITSTTAYSGYCFPSEYKASEMIEHTIQVGDLKIIAGQMSRVPLVGDTVTINGQAMRILNVFRTRMTGQDIIYTLQARV